MIKLRSASLDPELAAAFDIVKERNGWLIGLLTTAELSAFNKLCEVGIARKDYTSPIGPLGLGRVRLSTY